MCVMAHLQVFVVAWVKRWTPLSGSTREVVEDIREQLIVSTIERI